MNKQGFVRTIEAVIAIVVIFIFIFTVIPKEKQELRVPDNIKLVQDKVIKEIESNESLRMQVLEYPIFRIDYTLETIESSLQRQQLNLFIETAINIPTIDFNYTVCDEANINCAPDFLDKGSKLYQDLPNKQIYAKSIMVSTADKSRIVRLYLWEKF